MIYSLILSFDTDEPEFARGVEVGMLHSTLSSTPQLPFSVTIHATNAEMVMRLATAHRLFVKSRELSEDFLEVIFDVG